MKTSTKWLISAALSSSLVVAWVTASAISSNKVAQMLNTAATQGWPDSSFKIRNLHHQAGWFASHGDLELAYVDKCNPMSGDDTTWLQVTYNMSHMLLPSSLMRFDWRLQPTGEAKIQFEKIFQGTVALSGHGHMRLGESFDTDLNLPALAVTSSGSHFDMSPTKGFLSFSGDGVLMDIANDKTNFRGHGQALEIQQLKFSLDLNNRKSGTGSSTVSIGKISSSDLTLEGLSISSKAQLFDGRYSMNLSYQLNKAAYQQHRLSDLVISYAVNGLHGESVAKLIALSGVSCGFQNMTNEESQQLRSTLKTLLTKGLSTGLTAFNAHLEKGKLEGKFMLDLAKNDHDQIELNQHLKVQGSLQMDSAILTPTQQQSALELGFTNTPQQGLIATIDLANSRLKLNNKDVNAPMVSMMLTELERKLDEWLNNAQSRPGNATGIDLLPGLSDADLPAAEAPAASAEH